MNQMSFTVSLSAETVRVEPGIATPIAVEIANNSSGEAVFNLEFDGIDPTWVTAASEVTVAPGESGTARLFIRPPRQSENLAGAYPFTVNVHSESEGSKSVSGVLQLESFHNISVDVQPRRGVVTAFGKKADLQVTAMNLGNVEQVLHLSAVDNEDWFSFDCEPEQITVGPGHQAAATLTATSNKRSLLSNVRLQGFTITARDVNDPSVASSAHGQIEQRPIVTPNILGLGLFVVILFFMWMAFLPKPPAVDTLTISPDRPWVGDTISIHWSTSNARAVKLVIGTEVISDLEPAGTFNYVTKERGELQVNVTAIRGSRNSSAKTRSVAVREPEPVPDPVIEEFSIEPTDLVVGQKFLVRYKFNDAVTEATLDPIGIVLDPRQEGVMLTAEIPGEFEYKLTARNTAGQEVDRIQNVTVVRGSKASIITFRAEPAVVDPFDGRVTLTYQLENALRIEIRYADTILEIDEPRGQRDFQIFRDTTFTLVGYDDEGVTIEREVSVTVRDDDDFLEPLDP